MTMNDCFVCGKQECKLYFWTVRDELSGFDIQKPVCQRCYNKLIAGEWRTGLSHGDMN
jgi:hypothetical protein